MSKQRTKKLRPAVEGRGSFRERFERFTVGYMAGAGWVQELEWLREDGLPPVGHFHNESGQSCGLGRADWVGIASWYFETLKKTRSNS